MNLWIDDKRKCPQGWDWALNSEDAIRLIQDNPRYDWISFDHDLGMTEQGDEDTVRRVINTLWVYGDSWDKLPLKISSQSSNNPGREWVEGTFGSISRHVRHVEIVDAPAWG